MSEELFRSPDLLVRGCTGFSTACCVVTFDSFTNRRTLDRPGFGEEFFQSRNIDAIHVISRENEWYQYADMERAMEAVRAITRGYARTVTYGSSMGGYAAIRLAELAGASCALAMSPQYSIDQKVAQFERRWQESSNRFTPVWEARLPLPRLAEAYIVYDPNDLDGWHANLYRAVFAFTPVPLPQAGHSVSGFLGELGLLQAVVVAVCEGNFDAAATMEEAWRRRDQSLQHLLARAEQVADRAERLPLLAKAVARAPDNVACLSRMAWELGRLQRFDEALAMHRKAISLDPGGPASLHVYSETLQKSGDVPAALAVMEEIAALTGDAPIYAERINKLRRLLTRPNPKPLPALLRWITPRPPTTL